MWPDYVVRRAPDMLDPPWIIRLTGKPLARPSRFASDLQRLALAEPMPRQMAWPAARHSRYSITPALPCVIADARPARTRHLANTSGAPA